MALHIVLHHIFNKKNIILYWYIILFLSTYERIKFLSFDFSALCGGTKHQRRIVGGHFTPRFHRFRLKWQTFEKMMKFVSFVDSSYVADPQTFCKELINFRRTSRRPALGGYRIAIVTFEVIKPDTNKKNESIWISFLFSISIRKNK